jgi:hypothetical protein
VRCTYRLGVSVRHTESDYLSHFADMEEVEAAASPQDFARAAALGLLRSHWNTDAEDRGQLSLF